MSRSRRTVLMVVLSVLLGVIPPTYSTVAARAGAAQADRAAGLPARAAAFAATAANTQPVGGPPPGSFAAPAAARQELPQSRTRTSRTYALGDGSAQVVLAPGPINYRDGQGAWQPIANTLVPVAAPGYARQNRANGYALQLPADLGGAPVRVSAGAPAVEFALVGARGAPTFDGATATYADALPGVTVAYEAGAAAVKETLVLRDAAAPRTFAFTVKTSAGLTPKEVDGGLVFVDGGGAVQLAFEAPFMFDAKGMGAGRAGTVKLQLTPAAGGPTVTLAPDPAWLADPARQWPVTIDPTVIAVGTNNLYCNLFDGAGATTSTCNRGNVDVGFDGAQRARTTLQFDIQGALPAQRQILSAELGLYSYGSSAAGADPLALHRVTRAWTTNATWNTADGAAAWAAPGGDFDPAAAWTTTVDNTGGWRYWYPTRLVQDWYSGGVANNGLLLKAADETRVDLVHFYSPRYTDSTRWPVLTVTLAPWTGDRGLFTLERQRLNDRLDLAVNVANGNLLIHQADLRVRGTGTDLRVERTYNSLAALAGERADLGTGWALSGGRGVGLLVYPASVAFKGPSGEVLPFDHNGDGSYTPPSVANAQLVGNGDGTYTLTFNASAETYTFSSGGMLTADRDRNGNAIAYAYNANNTLASITDTQGRVTTFGYTGGNITSMTDSAGRTYQYGYDGAGNLTSYIDPANGGTQLAYDGTGRAVRLTDPNGEVTTFAYDTSARLSGITRVTDNAAGTGPTTTFTYNAGSTVVTDANGHQTTYTYDGMGRVTRVRDAAGNAADTAYTANSNVQQRTDQAGQIAAYGYDSRNNLTSAQLPTGATTTWAYADAAHPYLPTKRTDPQGNSLAYGYSAAGNLTTVTNGLSTQNQYQSAYNGNGTLASTTDTRGNVTGYGYDARGNLTSVTPPAPLGGTAITYDTLSRIKTMQDGKGQVTTYTYDALDRVTQIAYAGGAQITYGYDADNLTSLTDNTGTTGFGYDRLNRPVSKTLPGGGPLGYAYDGVGNLTSFTDGGGTVTYAYNAVNLLQTLTEPGGYQTTFAYDKMYRRTGTAYPNGVTMAQIYDGAGRLTSIVGKNAGGATLTSFAYTYQNAAGADTALRQSMTDQGGNTTAYSYDVLNRLTGAQTTGPSPASYAYAYDGANNRTSQTAGGTTTTYNYNAANELTSAGSTTYSYDANGNQTGNSAGQALAYNAANQTTSITPVGGSAVTMGYTGASQVQRVSAGGASFQYGLLALNRQDDAVGTTYYTRGPQGELLGQRAPGGRYYYLYDGLGSTAALTDSAGAVVNRYSYDPWGKTLSSTGTVANPYRFGGSYGAYTDIATGLVKIGQRYYDPNLGRWTQRDPLGAGNPYSYASCNPTNRVDLTGAADCGPEILAFAAAVAAELAAIYSGLGLIFIIPLHLASGATGAALDRCTKQP